MIKKHLFLCVLVLTITMFFSIGLSAQSVDLESIALVLPGSITDESWNQSAYLGLMALQEQGYRVSFTENTAIAVIESTLRHYAASGYNLVIGHGFQFGDPTLRVADQFPNTWFFVFGKNPDDVVIPPNVQFIDQRIGQAAYICGVFAALMSESNVIGYVGGIAGPPQVSSLNNYTHGARSVKPDIVVRGVLVGSFRDPAAGKEAALAMIEDGADVIMHTADLTGIGAIEAARENNVFIIGYGSDQSHLAPGLVLTSLREDIPGVIARQARLIEEGTFGGDVWRPGVPEGIIELTQFGDFVPKEVADQVMAVKNQIISGALDIQEDYTPVN